MGRTLRLLDIVAVLSHSGDADVEMGDVGTVVEVLPPDGLQVEFLDRDGRTRCVVTLTVTDVLVLNRMQMVSRECPSPRDKSCKRQRQILAEKRSFLKR
jgi:hypothetical protein